MALKVVVDKLDDVPEAFRGEYKEVNGKFELDAEIPGIDGVKRYTDFSKLNGALVKERNEHKATKQTYSVLGDRKVEEVVALLDRIPELELAAEGKVDDAKINEMVEKRIGAKVGPVQRQVQTLTTQLAEKDKVIETFVTKERTRAIHDGVREAIGKSQGFQPSATEDVMLLAERMFEVNEEGRVVTKDGVGVTPGIDAVVWLTEMQNKRPHWWGSTSGGGAGGNNGKAGGSAGKNPWSRENWNLTEQGQMLRADRARAEQMAKSAGSFVGAGVPPAAKK